MYSSRVRSSKARVVSWSDEAAIEDDSELRSYDFWCCKRAAEAEWLT